MKVFSLSMLIFLLSVTGAFSANLTDEQLAEINHPDKCPQGKVSQKTIDGIYRGTVESDFPLISIETRNNEDIIMFCENCYSDEEYSKKAFGKDGTVVRINYDEEIMWLESEELEGGICARMNVFKNSIALNTKGSKSSQSWENDIYKIFNDMASRKTSKKDAITAVGKLKIENTENNIAKLKTIKDDIKQKHERNNSNTRSDMYDFYLFIDRYIIEQMCLQKSIDKCSQMLPDFPEEYKNHFVMYDIGGYGITLFQLACALKTKDAFKSFKPKGMLSKYHELHTTFNTIYFSDIEMDKKYAMKMKGVSSMESSIVNEDVIKILIAEEIDIFSKRQRKKVQESGKELHMLYTMLKMPHIEMCKEHSNAYVRFK